MNIYQKMHLKKVVPYIGTWIETFRLHNHQCRRDVVPYIGTWIETPDGSYGFYDAQVVPYIGTWIETLAQDQAAVNPKSRTLYRYVD